MNIKKATSIFLVGVTVATSAMCLSSCSKVETTELATEITQLTDSDDNELSVVAEASKSNIIVLKDSQGNQYSVIPILDVTGKIVIAGYIKSAVDKNDKEITDKNIITKVLAISTDDFGVHSITLKNEKIVYLDYYTGDDGLIIALESADDGKYYEVTSTKDESSNISMQLTADKNGNPVEVTIKKDGSNLEVVEASSGKVVAKSASKNKTNSNNNTTKSTTKKDETVSTDKVVTVSDYSDLADIDIVLTKNSTASVGLNSSSPVSVKATSKAYVKNGVLYLQGNGDYYISQSSDTETWWGKIVVNLGNKGLARVRMAGVNIRSKDTTSSAAIEFKDTDTVINDTETDSEVLVKYNNTSTSKNNPNAVLSFVDGTTNTLYSEGSSAKGAGTIYSECKLSIQGHGTANITSKNKNGIQALRSLGIQNATLNIVSDSAKGIRVQNLLDIEEGANINVTSVGDSIRCGEFLMDVDKDDSGNKDMSTGSKVTLRPTSTEQTSTTGDGIDADDSAIIRAGTLDIFVNSTKSKYGIKVRRVNNEEFIKIIKSENITNISTWKKENSEDTSVYYNDVALNEKEYTSLLKVADVDPSSSDYQGIRTAEGYTDTFRITGGTVLAELKLGRNSSVKDSLNSQISINAFTKEIVREITIGSKQSSTTVRAMLYSTSSLEKCAVVFAKSGKNKQVTVTPTFTGYAGKATDA